MPLPKTQTVDTKKRKHLSKSAAAEQEQNMADLEKQRALEDPNLTRYAYIIEDKQADDITLIAIRRV